MPSNYTVDDDEVKFVVIPTFGYEKMHVTVMLVVLADGSMLPPYMILNCKTMPKEQLPRRFNVRCHPEGWMANEPMKEWLAVVWNRRPGVILRKWGMLLLDAIKEHQTQKATMTGCSMITDVGVIPEGDNLTTTCATCCGELTLQKLPKAAVQ